MTSRFFIGAVKSKYRAASRETAVTRDEAWNLVNHWVTAWNAHGLDSIMTHHEDAVELISPVAALLLGASGGKVAGKEELRAYFQPGARCLPGSPLSP
jgi:hypothetical protein